MDRSRVRLLYHTVKYLKAKQIVFRLFYLVRNRFFKLKISEKLQGEIIVLTWRDLIFNKTSFENKTFTFLNISKQFDKGNIDWNLNEFGKLWTYNLTYFDFLNQNSITDKEGLSLITSFVKNREFLKDALEPYPISLRTINWVKFLSKNKINNVKINESLFEQTQILSKNLEYHLLANHLLENGFGLFFGAYYFRNLRLLRIAKKILHNELEEQILRDGGHFELSPMYHQILLYRLLDCIHLIKQNTWEEANSILPFMELKASSMLSWLNEITYNNGDIPMVNDSAYGIAPSSEELFNYATKLVIPFYSKPLSDSGYRVFKKQTYELLLDIGNIGPSYQPGHAHSDTFNFELRINNKPFIVDVGTSTYEKNDLRLSERITSAHNTMKIEGYEQSDVWGGFRVGRRAKIKKVKERGNNVEAVHDGYKKMGVYHTRSFGVNENEIIIMDSISKNISQEKYISFHLHSDILNFKVIENKIIFENPKVLIEFKGAKKVQKKKYQLANGFNQRVISNKFEITFDQLITSKIKLL